MRISLVVAMAANRAIGRGGTLPWRLPNDLRHFKTLTTGKPVVMGRKTFASIGRPLPDRTSIVVSRDPAFRPEGALVVNSFEAALNAAAAAAAGEIMVIGGAEIYAAALPLADRIYVTEVHADVEGDRFFPPVDPGEWVETFRERHEADDRHAYGYSFVTLERRASEVAGSNASASTISKASSRKA